MWLHAQDSARFEFTDGGVQALLQPFPADLLEVAVDGVAFGNGELREGIVDLGQLERAALGELHGAVDDFGRVREELLHLAGGFDVELVGVELEALGIVDRGERLDAEQNVVRVGVVFAEVVAVVGGDERDVEVFFEAEEIGVDLLFELEALVLNFEEEVAAAEDVLVLRGSAARGLVVPFHQVLAELAGEAAGEADESCGVFGEIFLADARLAIEAVERGLRRDADEVAVALFVFGEDEQVVVVVALRLGAMVVLLADVELAAEDGLDAARLGGVEEVDGSVDVAVIGDGNGLLADVGDALHELFYVTSAIEEGVVGVQMQVGEFSHDADSILVV